jgi:hypothetical protein
MLLVLADARAPDMQLWLLNASSRSTEQLGLPSDHTSRHLVKQVALSCAFLACVKKQREKREDPRGIEVLGSGLAYQVRGDTDAPAVGTRRRCAPACNR